MWLQSADVQWLLSSSLDPRDLLLRLMCKLGVSPLVHLWNASVPASTNSIVMLAGVSMLTVVAALAVPI
jgi:hypothetical protein